MYENDFCEYAVVRKKEGAYLAKIIAAAAFAIVFALVSFVFVVPASSALGLVLIFADGALVWFLSRYLSIEYEYSLSGEYMDFAAIYSKQYRKEKLSVELKKSALKAMPYDGRIEGFNVASVLDLRSSSSSQTAYVLVYETDDVERAVLFDANRRIVENMFRQIPSLVVRSNSLPE